MLTFLAVSIVLLLIVCGLFSIGPDGPNLLSSSIVMLVLIIGAFWFFNDSPNSAGDLGGASASSVSHATVW